MYIYTYVVLKAKTTYNKWDYLGATAPTPTVYIYILYLIIYTYLNMSRRQNQLFTPGTKIS
jgi:hypothetical protein